MNKDRIINGLVLFLIFLGIVLIFGRVVSLPSSQALSYVGDTAKYLSLPLGILIKLFHYFDGKLKRIEEVKEIALNNRQSDESLREQIRFLRDDIVSSRTEISNATSELDRRLIRLEARLELASQIERHERLIREQNDRIAKLGQ